MSSRWVSSLVTHTGLVRSANEDRGLDRTPAALWAVADGMGGHVNGARAAETVISLLGRAEFASDTLDAAIETVNHSLKDANAAIHSEAAANGQMSGATAVVLTVRGDQFACLWAGDSRCYILRDGQLYRLSLDHTVVRDMMDRGLLASEAAADHPMRHVLSRVVGGEANLDVDAIVDQWLPDDVFLLCSDGLTGVIDDSDIQLALAGGTPKDACQRLLDLTLQRGAPDNVTIIVVRPEEATAVRLEPAS